MSMYLITFVLCCSGARASCCFAWIWTFQHLVGDHVALICAVRRNDTVCCLQSWISAEITKK